MSFDSFCQYNETIRTARPGQSVGPFTTGRNIFQVQTGFTYGEFENDDLLRSGDNIIHTTSLRYGILEDFEIRSAFRIRSDEVLVQETIQERTGGFSFWNAGIRYNIVNGLDGKPAIGFQTDVKLTWVDEDYRAREVAPRLMLIHGQKLTNKLNLTTNWAMVWSGNDESPRGTYTINISFPIAKKWRGFVENYGQISNGDLDTRWDTGLGYLVNNDFLLDMAAGFGKNEGLSDWFVDGGISWRINVKE